MSYNRMDSLLTNETGVQPGSQYYISTEDMSSREMFQYLKTCGHYYCNKHYVVRRDYYQFLLIACVISGEMLLEYGGKRYTAGPGEVLCIDCQTPHCYRAGEELEFVWMHVDGNISRQLCRELNRLGGPIVRNGQCGYIREQLDQVIDAYRRKEPLDLFVCSAVIYDVLCRMFMGTARSKPSENKLVMTAIEYMRYNLVNDISVADIASAVSCDPEEFVRAFRKITGHGPLDYLVQLRLGLAQHLLATTAQTVGQIARAVGYPSGEEFKAAFYRQMEVTPEAYRKDHKLPAKPRK